MNYYNQNTAMLFTEALDTLTIMITIREHSGSIENDSKHKL